MSELAIKGIYRDRLLDAAGQVIFDSGWKSNLIVARCRVLLASFMNNEAAARGIQKLQVGQGLPEWDTTPPPAPDPNTTKLVDNAPFEIQLADLTIQYLNESDAVVQGPTNRLQIIVTLGPGKPPTDNYPLREFGLFGKLGNDFYMIDYIRHPLIVKSSSVTLERRVRLIF